MDAGDWGSERRRRAKLWVIASLDAGMPDTLAMRDRSAKHESRMSGKKAKLLVDGVREGDMRRAGAANGGAWLT